MMFQRGGAEPDSPVKNPMVAAVMPNTTNSNQHSTESGSMQSHTSAQLPQSEVKPLPNMQSSFPQQAGPNQFRPNYPFPPNNNSFPSQYSGMNTNYPNFNPQQQNDFHGMPPSYPGFQNHQGFSNQNQYPGFGGNYYSTHQDPSFSGGNYWNNPYFNNDHSSTGMFQNFNDSDPNNSNFYNQDVMGSDGFNAGHRGGYNSGMSMNRPGMSGMNPLQHNRMGMMNNPTHGMMGSNPSMGGMNSMNSMGMPMNNMNSSSANQNSFGSVNSGGQSMNMSSNAGMAPQYQGMGMNQVSGMGSASSQGHGGMNIPSTQSHIGQNSQTMNSMSMCGMNQVSQSNISQQSGPSIQNTSSGNMHSTNSQVSLMNHTSSHSTMEIQQEAAIQNIANNLMMSTQQLGGGSTHNSAHPNSLTSSHNPEQLRGNPQSMMGSQHESQEVLRDNPHNTLGNPQVSQNSPQNSMGSVNNQLGSLQEGPQSQGNSGGSQNSLVAPIQSNPVPSAQGSHMMANMLSSSQSSRGVSSHHNPVSMQGPTGHDSQSMMSNPQSMIRNQPNPELQGNSQNLVSIQNQQIFHGNQPNPSGMLGQIQNPMYRSQQPNQNAFSHQNSPVIGSHQSMFSGSSQPMQHSLGNPQTPMMNQHMMTNQHSSSSVSSFDSMGSHNMMTSQVGQNQSIMRSAQSQNIPPSQDTNMPSGNSLHSSIGAQQGLESLSGNQQGCQNNSPSQNMFSNQSVSNPMGNLQNMLSSQSMMQDKSHTDLSSNHPSLMAMNQNISTQHQQSVSGNQNVMSQHSRLNESAMMGQNILPNQSHNSGNLSLNALSDNNQPSNIFGMNANQPPYMNNPNMMGHSAGNSSAMNNQSIGSSQSMGLMMNNSSGLGMFGNQMNSQDMIGGSSGMMGSQMNNQPFNTNQVGPGSNMGMYNQPGMMNYSGMMSGNQMNSFGMVNQQSINNPTLHNQTQPYGNNMMGQPTAMRHPQTSSGFNPELNSGMMGNNFSSNQSSFGMFGNTIPSESYNQNNPSIKESSGSFPSSSTVNNNRFMSGGEFQSTNSQPAPQDQGNLSQNSFNNDFGNFGLNSNDTKMWDDLTNKYVEKPNPETIKSETERSVCGESGLSMEHEKSSQESNAKAEDIKSPNLIMKPYLEDEIGCEKKECEETSKEESKSPKAEGEDDSEEKKRIISTMTPPIIKATTSSREDAGIPYDWVSLLIYINVTLDFM